MEGPLVSVLLASYNHERYVEAAVRSVVFQEGVSFELIVIDDGSSDTSPQILERLSKEFGFRLVNRENRGLVATMNELLSLARGKYFCSFASDDIMPRGRLARAATFLEENPETIACFGQVINMDSSGALEPNIDARYSRSIPHVTFEEFFLGQKELHGCSEMVRTENFRKMGGYSPEFSTEDFQLCLRLLEKQSPLPVLSDVFCYYRKHEGNHSQKNRAWVYENMLACVETFYSHPLYSKAKNIWKSHYFSALAETDKFLALKNLPRLASFSSAFFRRFPKILIPRVLLSKFKK